MSQTDSFDNYSKEYEEWFERNKNIYKSELNAVKNFIFKNEKGLEIGIGTGRFAKPLGIETGIEPSESMRKIAADKGLEVHDGVGESIPFPDKSFDFILIVTTICFLNDLEKTMEECRRVLRENGKIIIGIVDRDTPLGQEYLQNKENNVFYKDAHFHSTEELLELLEKYKFKNIEIVQTVFGKLSEINRVQDFKKGYGEGGFAVIKADK